MLVIRNGKMLIGETFFTRHLLVEDGRIVAIEENPIDTGSNPIDQVDASGLLVLPGGVDAHTHLDLPMFETVSSDDHYTGTKAASFGGTTTIIDFVPLMPADEKNGEDDILYKSVEAWQQKAGKAAVDFSFHMNLTRYNAGIETQIPTLPEVGITSLKVFTAYNNRLRLDDSNIFNALRLAGDHGLLVMVHCEDGDVIDQLTSQALESGNLTPEWHAHTRPAWGAVDASQRMIALAAQAEAPLYLVHMNTTGEVDVLEQARKNKIRVMGETCPQYLFFTEEDLRRPDGAKWICSPPMRAKMDNQRLWQGLGTEAIQVLATDHCPFFFDGTKAINYEGRQVKIPGKELGAGNFTLIPNGLPGVGDRLPILWTFGVGSARLSARQFVELNCTNPAKIFGLYPQKGVLQVGSDADIVLWDPQKKVDYGVSVAKHRTDYNLYEGWELTGYPEKVFLRGELIVDGERWLGKAGQGRFLKRSPGSAVI